jgi:hypothetical protein
MRLLAKIAAALLLLVMVLMGLDVIVFRQHKSLDFLTKSGWLMGWHEAYGKLRAASTNGVRGGKYLETACQLA